MKSLPKGYYVDVRRIGSDSVHVAILRRCWHSDKLISQMTIFDLLGCDDEEIATKVQNVINELISEFWAERATEARIDDLLKASKLGYPHR